MKICPYCAEEIKDTAIFCRYCGKRVRGRHRRLIAFAVIMVIVAAFVGSHRAETSRILYKAKTYCEDMRNGTCSFFNTVKNFPKRFREMNSCNRRLERINRLMETEN